MSITITIITVCKNSEEQIRSAVDSVIAQKYPYIEYIVIDGGSVDSTLSILQEYKRYITRLISEPDQGIYDAMNKGVALATGEIIYFLNSDDRLYSDTVLSAVAAKFQTSPDVEAVYGQVEGQSIPLSSEFDFKRGFQGEYSEPTDFLENMFCHQRLFVRRGLFTKVGSFNIKYLINADFDWILRVISTGVSFHSIDVPVACYHCGGASSAHSRVTRGDKLSIVWRNCSLFHFFYYCSYRLWRKIKCLPLKLGIR